MLKETMRQLSSEQCAAYLNKLGLAAPEVLTRDWLDLLIRTHLEVIPFEDLTSAYLKQPVDISPDILFDKIVCHPRGGYCFELNTLFLGLLLGLGFEAWPVGCRVKFGPELRPVLHCGSMVELDGDVYFCDVGFGGTCSNRAVRVAENAVTVTEFAEFRFRREYRGWWDLDFRRIDQPSAEFQPLLMVCECAASPVDLVAPNLQVSSPGSRFVENIIVQRITPQGTLSIFNDQLTLRSENGTEVRTLENTEQLLHALKEYFGIEL